MTPKRMTKEQKTYIISSCLLAIFPEMTEQREPSLAAVHYNVRLGFSWSTSESHCCATDRLYYYVMILTMDTLEYRWFGHCLVHSLILTASSSTPPGALTGATLYFRVVTELKNSLQNGVLLYETRLPFLTA
jgi:hypothetical protein